MGFDFELAKLIAEDLDVRLAMVVSPSRDQLIPWLLEGRGDIIAASFTITETRGAHVAFSQPYLFVDEMVVSRAGDPPMTTLIGRRRWKKEVGYHRQARVENAFFRYKSILGDRLRSRTRAAQAVESVRACNVLNRMTELGRPESCAIDR